MPKDKTDVPWTQKETDILITNYRIISAAKIGEKVGRSREAVLGKAYRIGLTPRKSRKTSHTVIRNSEVVDIPVRVVPTVRDFNLPKKGTTMADYYEIDGVKYLSTDKEVTYRYVNVRVLAGSIRYPDVEDPTKTAARRKGDEPLMRLEHAEAMIAHAKAKGKMPAIEILSTDLED